MATKADSHAGLEPATQADIDAALGPFIERFLPKDKRGRAASLFLPLKKRARPRDLVEIIENNAVVQLDGSPSAAAAIARISADLEGIYLNGKPAAFRTSFGRARELGLFSYSDEEIFIACDGRCGLVNFEIGGACLVVLP